MKKYESPKLEVIELKVEDIMYISNGDDGIIEWNLTNGDE